MQKNYCIAYAMRKIKPSPHIDPMLWEVLKPLLMRLQLVTLLIALACVQVSARVNAQSITLKLENETLLQAFEKIEKQSGYDFWYMPADFKNSKKVSGTFTNASIKTILDQILKDQPLSYEIVGRTVAVKPTKSTRQIENIYETAQPAEPISGIVFDENGKALSGVTVTVKGTMIKTVTGDDGKFTINTEPDATLVFGYIGYKTKEVALKGSAGLSVGLELETRELNEIKIGSTGYQFIPRERATGSYDFVDNTLINRRTGQNVLDRIENLTPGVLFDRSPSAPDPLLIRGRGTIYANAAPLIVLNNFPYDGDLSNINPNDVESITILKDAAAASIWGARAGNGVIVITTKRGRMATPQIQLNSNVTVKPRPDVHNVPRLSSTDFIENEKWLFDQGFYNSALNSTLPEMISPVVELLNAKKNGTINASDADRQIESLKNNDIYGDIQKYLYRPSVYQQYALNVSGNTAFNNYFYSVGYDKNLLDLKGNSTGRISLRAQNSFKISSKFSIDVALNVTQNITSQGGNQGTRLGSAGKNIYPYANLVNTDGTSASILYNYRNSFVDLAEKNGLLNWKYNPVDEIGNTSIRNKNNDYLVNAGLRYQIIEGLNLEGKYQYQNSIIRTVTNNGIGSYVTRNIINSFFQPSAANKFPVPVGAIVDYQNQFLSSHQARVQLNFAKKIDRHRIDAIAGAEVRSLIIENNTNRIYGFDPNRATLVTNMDFATSFPLYTDNSVTQKITNPSTYIRSTDNFVSQYANASYTYDDKYILSSSIRKDEANLFGVNANQRGTPLWSVGASWIVSNEDFIKSDWLDFLKARVTYGHSGNISRLTSAYTTATYGTSLLFRLPSATIQNPPNNNLRWEKVKTTNLGIDFKILRSRLSGSIEYYSKNASDLLGQYPVDPTYGLGDVNSGLSFYYGNVAAMKGSGFDVQINSSNLNGKFKWLTTAIFSSSRSRVTTYLAPVSKSGSSYLGETGINPVVGKPVFSMYSYGWAGLDHNTGDPQGILEKNPSKDYAKILLQPLDSLQYNGNVQPTVFGAIRNTFEYKRFSLSFNISYKLGSYFRNSSISYSALYNSWVGHPDYAKRWMKPGDENITSVPSKVYRDYTQFTNRDMYYLNSAVLVEDAGQIRFEDINLGYSFSNFRLGKHAVERLQLYIYANNIGLLWVANEKNIDPNSMYLPKQKTQVSIGLNLSL